MYEFMSFLGMLMSAFYLNTWIEISLVSICVLAILFGFIKNFPVGGKAVWKRVAIILLSWEILCRGLMMIVCWQENRIEALAARIRPEIKTGMTIREVEKILLPYVSKTILPNGIVYEFKHFTTHDYPLQSAPNIWIRIDEKNIVKEVGARERD